MSGSGAWSRASAPVTPHRARRSARLAASEEKKLKRGVKEVVKSIRKGAKGLCIIAGDISPLDVVSHLPVFCEESGVQYVFVTSKVRA